MYLKITRSGPRRYVQLVEAFRDDHGRPRQKTIATLGRFEKVVEEADALINSLGKLVGREGGEDVSDLRVAFDHSRSLGDIHVLQSLWEQLGFDLLRRVFRSTTRTTDVELLLRVMVFNRLCNPESKLGVLRWLETVHFPGDVARISHQQLLRSMDTLVTRQDKIEEQLAQQLRPLIDDELSVVFYDLTTVTVHGETEFDDDIRKQGLNKEGGYRRQVVIGVVQTAEGIPLSHQVFEGNVSEASTLMPMLQRLTAIYPIRRVIIVADRGLLNLGNLKALEGVALPSGEKLEYIMAVPASRYSDFGDIIAPLNERNVQEPSEAKSWIDETRWQHRRVVVDHSFSMAEKKRDARQTEIEKLEQLARELCVKLDKQDAGEKIRGRKLSEGGATARFFQAVKEARLGHLIEVDLESGDFGWYLKGHRQQALEALDGKLILVTNVEDLEANQIVDRYRALADIERGFRVLKSEIEIGPMYHRLPKRIRAHAMICFLALVLHRVMRFRLKEAGQDVSPERSLETLSRIQHHRIKVNGKAVTGLTTLKPEQMELLRDLQVSRPNIK